MASAFTVSPMSQKIELTPGETFTGSILVANPAAATEDFHYKVVVYPYSTDAEGNSDYETMTDWSKITEWVHLDGATGVLKPNEMKKVHFVIEVPENAPGGGQYLMLGVSEDRSFGSDNSSVRAIYEMASVIYAAVDGETVHEGEILENSLPGLVLTGKPTLSIKLSNTGNVHETATTKIFIKNSLTGEILLPKEGEDDEFETVVMPGSTRLVLKDLANLPAVGAVEVNEEVSYLDQTMSLSTTIILCPVWLILLVLALFCSIVAMCFYACHLKKRKIARQNLEN